MAVFGLREQHAGKEGAERGREAGIAGGGGEREHDQQRDRHDQLAAAGLRGEMEDRPQHEAPDHRDDRDRHRRLGERERETERDARLASTEHLRAQQHRRHHQVLEEQHRECQLPERGRAAALLLEQLQHHRGRRHCEAEPEHDGGDGALADERERRRNRRRGQHESQAADADDEAAQRPQPLDRQLDADQEQQEPDAELGEGLHPLAMLDGEVAQPRMGLDPLPEPVGADGDAKQEEAEHRADARAMKQRNDEPGADQKDQDVLQPGLAAQVASSCRPLRP